MKLQPLSAEEVAMLPPRRSRWVCHVAAALVAALMAGWAWEVHVFVDDLDRAVDPAQLHEWESAILVIGTALLYWLPLAPFMRRVGYTWTYAVWMSVLPWVVPFLAWHVGFRLASSPYRDWRPGRHQVAYVRPIPGTGYHVTEQDLAR